MQHRPSSTHAKNTSALELPIMSSSSETPIPDPLSSSSNTAGEEEDRVSLLPGTTTPTNNGNAVGGGTTLYGATATVTASNGNNGLEGGSSSATGGGGGKPTHMSLSDYDRNSICSSGPPTPRPPSRSFLLHPHQESEKHIGGSGTSMVFGGGTASIMNEIMNLIKNLVGAGALGLPSGIAAFGNAPSALIPATIVDFAMCAIFAYYFLLMGRICKMTVTTSYYDAWKQTVGTTGSNLVAFTSTLMAGLGNLAYSMILADTTRSLSMAIGWELTRNQSLWLITILVLLPLCMVKNLEVLAPFSSLGIAGMVFTVVVMGIRYFDGTYDVERGGKYLSDLPEELQPSFGTKGASAALSPEVLYLVCMFNQAFFCHYNAPRYYMELRQSNIQRFSMVVFTSFPASALIYALMSTFGFLTFGSNSDGFILNNYSDKDTLASVCRFGIAIALVFTFPLPFIGVRDGVLDLLHVSAENKTPKTLNLLTILILIFITILAMIFHDLGMVNAVGGGTLGTAVVFVFPALMFRSYVVNIMGMGATKSMKRECLFAMGLMWEGIGMGAIGVWMAIFGGPTT